MRGVDRETAATVAVGQLRAGRAHQTHRPHRPRAADYRRSLQPGLLPGRVPGDGAAVGTGEGGEGAETGIARDRHRQEGGGPREKLAMKGPGALSDTELLAVLLGTGCADEPVGVLAARLLESAGGLGNLYRLGVAEMARQNGIGPGKACRISAAFELGRRAAARPLDRGQRVTCSRDVVAALGGRLPGAVRDHFWVVPLDTKNRPLAEVEVAVGSLNTCALNPADIFRAALRQPCASVVLVHNHPSGEPSPSEQDIELTRRLGRAGELIGIAVLDHVIIAEQGYFSFCDAGLLYGSGGKAPSR